jgi:hypothetical protein
MSINAGKCGNHEDNGNINTLHPAAIETLISPVLAHFKTLWKLQSINTLSGRLV